MSKDRRADAERLSEQEVKTHFGDLDRRKLIAHLSRVELTTQDVERLVEIMSRGAVPIFKHPNRSAEAKRESCITAVSEHVDKVLGAGASQEISELAELIAQIEQGYRSIMEASDASSASEMELATRISAILLAGATSQSEQQKQILEEFKKSGFADPLGVSLETLSGMPRVDPDAVSDLSINVVTMSLLLQGYRAKLFDAQGIFVIPDLTTVGQFEVEQVAPVLLYAASWRFWEYIEEDTRYFGGDLKKLTGEDVPEEYRAREVETLWCHDSESLPWAFLNLAANERLHLQLKQNMQEVLFDPRTRQLAKGVESRVSLAPEEFVSAEEVHSAWALTTALSRDVLQDRTTYRGLRFAEWLRGYSALQALAAKQYESSGFDPKSLLHTLTKAELEATLMRLGLSKGAVTTFVGHASLCRASRDLFDTPLITMRDDQYLLYGPALVGAIPAQVILSRLASLGQSFETRGRAFEKAILELFQRQGLQAKSVKEKRGGEEFDFDVLVRWDPYLFLLECKSRSLSGPSKVASFNFLREVNTQIGQVHRLAKGLNDYPDILERHMGQGASALTLVPCVLNALPFAAGEMDRVYFTDASGIGRLFESETFNQRIVRGDTTITVPGPRLWAGSTIAPGDLMRQIDDSPQLKMALDELRVRDCFALVAPGVLATTKRPVREPKGSTERAAILDAGSTPGIGPDP